MNPLKILMVTSEMAPLAKTGGLADMVAGLSSALTDLGHDVRVVFPRYECVGSHKPSVERIDSLSVQRGTPAGPATVEHLKLRQAADGVSSGPRLYAIRNDDYYGRPGLYQESGRDYPDNLARFAYFCRAVVELMCRWAREEGWMPDVVHGHDWQAGLLPVYLKSDSATLPFASAPRTLLTLHNVGYQGIFPGSQFSQLGLPQEYFSTDALEFYGSVNLLKGGILFADYLTTVSPTYCREIQTPECGFGLESVLHSRRDRIVGIVNGIDTEVWNPGTDRWIPARYTVENLDGKAICKTALQRECGLPARDVPLLAVVSRLVSQKGIDLVVGAAPSILQQGAQLVVLGTGEPDLEVGLKTLETAYPSLVKVFIRFDEGLSHRIQAGADLFLVPSRYEPCGLTQLYSLRYGTVPVVRRTGGLADTIIGVSDSLSSSEWATGFLFEEPSDVALSKIMDRAITEFTMKPRWSKLIRCGMQTDVGWKGSARRYVGVYGEMMGEP